MRPGGTTFGDQLPCSVTVPSARLLRALDPAIGSVEDRPARVAAAPSGGALRRQRRCRALSGPAFLRGSHRLRAREGRVPARGHRLRALERRRRSPRSAAFSASGWAPRNHDQDGDGIDDDLDRAPRSPRTRTASRTTTAAPTRQRRRRHPRRDDKCPTSPRTATASRTTTAAPTADNDSDGIPDDKDACPNERRDVTAPRTTTAARDDPDDDGIPDELDKCPTSPRTPTASRTRRLPRSGQRRRRHPRRGRRVPDDAGRAFDGSGAERLPDADRRRRPFPDDEDKCPDEPENFNGIEDEDGCPDEGGKPLVTRWTTGEPALRLAAAIKLAGAADAPTIDPATLPVLRALALELHRNSTWTAVVGARPVGKAPDAEAQALGRAIVLVDWLAKHVRRERVAETVGWDAVRRQPGAEASGIGIAIFVEPAVPPAAPFRLPRRRHRRPEPRVREAPSARRLRALSHWRSRSGRRGRTRDLPTTMTTTTAPAPSRGAPGRASGIATARSSPRGSSAQRTRRTARAASSGPQASPHRLTGETCAKEPKPAALRRGEARPRRPRGGRVTPPAQCTAIPHVAIVAARVLAPFCAQAAGRRGARCARSSSRRRPRAPDPRGGDPLAQRAARAAARCDGARDVHELRVAPSTSSPSTARAPGVRPASCGRGAGRASGSPPGRPSSPPPAQCAGGPSRWSQGGDLREPRRAAGATPGPARQSVRAACLVALGEMGDGRVVED